MAAFNGNRIELIAKKHSVSSEVVETVVAALKRGGGRMAQFSHPEFGGMSQWSPGMSMVGDMFNRQLNAKLDALCSEIAADMASMGASNPEVSAANEVSYRSLPTPADWWPGELGRPGAVGSQNELRYAIFPDTSRLAIDDHGTISVYNTGRHRIFGVAQEQSSDQTLSFESDNGLVQIADLPKLG